MTTVRRLTDSTLLVTGDDHATLFDPGFHTFSSGEIDLQTIGDVTRVLITHEHADHVDEGFVRWLVDRDADLTVHSNQAVADLLAPHGIEVSTTVLEGVSHQDVLHEPIASGATPPNRSYTVDGVITHPGDSRQPTVSAAVLALPLIVPWDSVRGAVEFAMRVRPNQVVAIHDHYLTESGRSWVRNMARSALAGEGIELVDIDWGGSFTV
jgi:hypothetical protein